MKIMDWRALLALSGLFSLSSAIKGERRSSTPSSTVSSLTGSSSAHTPTPSTSSPLSCTSTNGICSCPSPITSAAELDELLSCTTFHGNLTLQINKNDLAMLTSQGGFHIPVTTIYGSLQFLDMQSASFPIAVSMQRLTTVEDDILFQNISPLEMPSFPLLQSANSISFQDIHFSEPGASFSGAASTSTTIPNVPSLDSVRTITFNNTNVTYIGPFALGTSESLDLYVLENTNCESVDLARINTLGTALLNNNNLLTYLDLTNLGGATLLELSGNTALASLDLPNLTSVSNMSVANNTELKSIELPLLSTVYNSLNLSGPINSVNFSPNGISGGGHVDISSTGTLICDQIPNLPKNADCTNSPQTTTVSPSSTSTSGSSPSATAAGSHHTHGGSSLSSKATIGIGVGVGVGGALILALALFFCWRSRHRTSHTPRNVSKEYSSYTGKGDHYAYREVPYEAGAAKQTRGESQSEEHTPSTLVGMSDGWVPPEDAVPTAEGRTELEEQQGQRHEMDARSIDFSDDDEEAETRSLEDIERVHRQ